jgi:hypothetical protein
MEGTRATVSEFSSRPQCQNKELPYPQFVDKSVDKRALQACFP